MELATKIVVLTMYVEDRYIMEAVRMGAAGYVLKRSADKELIEAIRAGAAGEPYLTPAAVRLLLATQQTEAGRTEAALSPREREVLRFTARGFSNLEMAKPDLHRRSRIVDYALRHGLLE